MVGNMIYLLFRRDLRKEETTLIAPHATFDGAFGQIEAEREYWEKVGKAVQRNLNGSLYVKDLHEPMFYYFVSTRTIIE